MEGAARGARVAEWTDAGIRMEVGVPEPDRENEPPARAIPDTVNEFVGPCVGVSSHPAPGGRRRASLTV